MAEWFYETLHKDWQQGFSMDKVLFREQTEHQDLIIFENQIYGRVLALDGIIQTTQADEFVYHEAITHIPLIGHGAARKVLIIGGGDGGTAREVLKHRAVEAVVMVEIDRSVVDMSIEHLPSLSAGAFDNPRLRLVIADGVKFVAETDETFDVIIIDSTDPVGPGQVLFTESFYGQCKHCLTPGGVLVTQNGVPWVQADELRAAPAKLGAHFRDVSFYIAPVPTYVGGYMAFGWACDDVARRMWTLDMLKERQGDSGILTAEPGLRHYAPDVHMGAFALPPWMRRIAGI